jgi:hypothetical protein
MVTASKAIGGREKDRAKFNATSVSPMREL